MKASLKEYFRSIDILDPLVPLRERIGGLYLWGHQIDHPEVQYKLRSILTSTIPQDEKQLQVALHTAILLAQNGEYEGVKYLLALLEKISRKESLDLIEVALRNCSQFPLAALIAQTLDLKSLQEHKEDIRELLLISDDDLFELAQNGNAQANLAQLSEKVSSLASLPQKNGRQIALGTILSTPLRQDRGFRYTGFVVIDRPQHTPLVIPYDTGDVLNRNDQRARQDILQLLRPPGRKAMIVYQELPLCEAHQLYVFPFPPIENDQLEMLVAQIGQGASGLEVGMVAELEVNKHGDYRVITSEGETRVMGFKRDSQKIGNIFLRHPLNSQMISTRLRFNSLQIAEFASLFKKCSELDRAVYIRTHKNRHYFASASGEIVSKPGKVFPKNGYFVETVITRDGKQFKTPFEIPNLEWESTERSNILAKFFQKYSEAIGVVLESYEYDGKLYARAVQAQTGYVTRPQVDEMIAPGTIVYYETGTEGRLFSNPIPYYRLISPCLCCFGTGYSLCESCDATGEVICSDCDGEGFVTCPECNGDGRSTCGHCDGKGEREVDCRDCGGSGDCSGCQGSGLYIAGDCNRCNGYGTINGYTCTKCGGDGKYKLSHRWCDGTGKCNKCGGTGIKTIPCRTCDQTGLWGCGVCHEHGTVTCGCRNGKMECPECTGARISRCSCRHQGDYKIVSV